MMRNWLVHQPLLGWILLSLIFGAPACLARDQLNIDQIFKNIASDLVTGIDKSQTVSGRSIVVAPFSEENITIRPTVADDINDRLYSALLKNAPDRFEFIARDTIKDVIQDMEQTGALSGRGQNLLPKMIENIKEFDILISGSVGRIANGVKVSYKATSITGRLIAATGPHKLPIGPVKRNKLSVKRALREAVKSLSGAVPDLELLYLCGIRYQNTGAQSQFSTWFQSHLETQISEDINNSISDRHIKTIENDGCGESVLPKKGAYRLSGNYWLIDNEVEVRIKLSGKVRTAPWIGRIKEEDIPGISLYPKGDVSALRASDGGPMFFQLSTNRGLDPVFHFGENFSFNLRVGEPSWVYCFYLQANGQLIQILPNPFFWQTRKQPKFSGNVLHAIPDKELFPFELKVNPPPGVELIKCFATSRDVTNDLPKTLRGRSLDVLPKGQENRLSEIFKRIAKTQVTESSLVVTVIDRKLRN